MVSKIFLLCVQVTNSVLLTGILVTASQNDNNEYDYNIVTVVLMTEVFKLVASISLYLKE